LMPQRAPRPGVRPSSSTTEENSTSGLRRSGALSVSGVDGEGAKAKKVEASVAGGDRSSATHETGQRSQDRRSHHQTEEVDGVSKFRVDPEGPASLKTDKPTAVATERPSHVDTSTAVATDATARVSVAAPISIAKERQKTPDTDGPKTAFDKATKAAVAARSHELNGCQAPVVVSKNASAAGSLSNGGKTDDDREKAEPLTKVPLEQLQTNDVKSVAPDMVIIDVPHQRQSATEGQSTRTSGRHELGHSNGVEIPTTAQVEVCSCLCGCQFG